MTVRERNCKKIIRKGGNVVSLQDYLKGGIEYRNDMLEAIYHSEGRVFFEGGMPQYEFRLADHLDNTRVLFSDKNGDGMISENEISDISSYYAFGLRHRGINAKINNTHDYLFNNKERVGDFGLRWDFYDFRVLDSEIGRFIHVDPIAEQFPWVSPFNYAENEPVAHIDLHGLQKADPPFFKASGHLGITAGESGLEVNLLGSKTGMTIMTGSTDIIGGSVSFDSNSGFSSDGSFLFSNNEETFGISGGDIFGGELSATLNSETGESTITTSASLGLFSLRNEFSKDADGNTENNQFLSLEFGVNAGLILGFDASISIDINITPTNQPVEETNNEQLNQIQQDNTKVIIPNIIESNNN